MVLINGEVKPTKYQKGTEQMIARKAIVNAPYNPRVIDDYSRRELERAIKQEGLLGPLQWNERTGNLIGGHQRLGCLDALEGTDDYSLFVTAFDVDDKTEKRWNVMLNSDALRGSFDADLITKMLQEDAGIAKVAGLAKMDLAMMGIADAVIAPLFEVKAQPPSVQADAEKIKAIKDRKKQARMDAKKADATDWWAVLVFENTDETTAFMASIGEQADARYLKGAKLQDIVKRLAEAKAALETGDTRALHVALGVPPF